MLSIFVLTETSSKRQVNELFGSLALPLCGTQASQGSLMGSGAQQNQDKMGTSNCGNERTSASTGISEEVHAALSLMSTQSHAMTETQESNPERNLSLCGISACPQTLKVRSLGINIHRLKHSPLLEASCCTKDPFELNRRQSDCHRKWTGRK